MSGETGIVGAERGAAELHYSLFFEDVAEGAGGEAVGDLKDVFSAAGRVAGFGVFAVFERFFEQVG